MNSQVFILFVIMVVLSVALISSSILEQSVDAKKKVRQKIKIKNDCSNGAICSSCGINISINISGGKIQIKGDC